MFDRRRRVDQSFSPNRWRSSDRETMGQRNILIHGQTDRTDSEAVLILTGSLTETERDTQRERSRQRERERMTVRLRD